MAVFPRNIAPAEPGWPAGPAPLISRSHSSKPQVRSTLAAGVMWSESWAPLQMSNVAERAFLADVQSFARTGIELDIRPFHHRTAKGTIAVDATGAVDGAGQSGTTLVTDGWSVGGTVKKGDYITVVGVPYALWIMADATASGGGSITFTVDPPVFVGPTQPLDNAVVTLNGLLRARIVEPPSWPEALQGLEVYRGLRLTFAESRE